MKKARKPGTTEGGLAYPGVFPRLAPSKVTFPKLFLLLNKVDGDGELSSFALVDFIPHHQTKCPHDCPFLALEILELPGTILCKFHDHVPSGCS